MKRSAITSRASKLSEAQLLERHDRDILGKPQKAKQDFASVLRLLSASAAPPRIRPVSFAGVDDAASCGVSIKAGMEAGAGIGGAAGTAVPGVGNAVGATVGAIGGAIVAAVECGLFEWLIEGLEAFGDWLADLFMEDPVGNYQTYIDVGGPALRKTNWTPDDGYDRYRLDLFVATPKILNLVAEKGLSGPQARAQVQTDFNKRVPGTNLSFVKTRWLLRRFEELGGGAAELEQLNFLLGTPNIGVKKDASGFYKAAEELRRNPNWFRPDGRPALGMGLRRIIREYEEIAHAHGYNGVEALNLAYGQASVARKGAEYKQLKQRAELELAGLRALLASPELAPTPDQLQEREVLRQQALNRTASSLQSMKRFGRAIGLLPSEMQARMKSLSKLDVKQILESRKDDSSAAPILVLVALGAFLLLRK